VPPRASAMGAELDGGLLCTLRLYTAMPVFLYVGPIIL